MNYAILVSIGVLLLIVFGFPIMLAKFYRKVDQGKALIVNTTKDVKVTFTGRTVVPVFHRAEVMDISVKTIEIDRRGKEGLICKDNIRADIKVNFFVRVNQTQEDVLKVAQSVGCARASDQRTLEELFGAKFSEALKTVGKRLNFEDLYVERARFKDDIIDVIGEYLNGYKLEDVAIDYLEQTPLEHLDPNNILDSQGIQKIINLTSEQKVLTNEKANDAKKKIGKQDMETKMAMLEYERQEQDSIAKTQRAIEVTNARERAETEEIKADQMAKEEKARLKAEEEINIRRINKEREEEMTLKNKERVLALETENVEKDRSMAIVAREKVVDLERIGKEKALEKEKKEIEDLIRDRVEVHKTVVEQEEQTKDLQEVAAAERAKKVVIIEAEAKAQQKLVVDIKAAEAGEEVSKIKARERLVDAQAKLESADKEAKSKIRLAEGDQAEEAAPGLARVKVEEAQAAAMEKKGMVEARVLKEKMLSEAAGLEEQGMADIRLKEATAAAMEKQGLTEAKIMKEKMLSEATGEEEKGMAKARVLEAESAAREKQGLMEALVLHEKMQSEAQGLEKQGMAHARVKEADAAAIEKLGLAEAVGIEKRGLAEAAGVRERLVAESDGLARKAEAMKALDATSRDHEEFRLKLEQHKAISVEAIHSNVELARAQAQVIAEAFKAAKINIVGGDGDFFNRFIKAISIGQTIDGFVDNSHVVKALGQDYMSGKASLPSDIKDILTHLPLTTGDIQRLSLSALLARLTTQLDDDKKAKMDLLIDKAKELGIDELFGVESEGK